MQLAGSELLPTRMNTRQGPQRKRQRAWPNDMHSIAADGLLLLWVGRSKYCFNNMLQAEWDDTPEPLCRRLSYWALGCLLYTSDAADE